MLRVQSFAVELGQILDAAQMSTNTVAKLAVGEACFFAHAALTSQVLVRSKISNLVGGVG